MVWKNEKRGSSHGFSSEVNRVLRDCVGPDGEGTAKPLRARIECWDGKIKKASRWPA